MQTCAGACKSTSWCLGCRRSLQEQVCNAQADNAALKDTVSRLRSMAEATTNLTMPQAIRCVESGDAALPVLQSGPDLEGIPAYNTHYTQAGSMQLQQQLAVATGHKSTGEGRVLFHWSGCDWSQLSNQRDKALQEMTAMASELEQVRCQLRCVHRQLQAARQAEEDADNVRGALLLCVAVDSWC